MRRTSTLVLTMLAVDGVGAEQTLPIIDVHMHASYLGELYMEDATERLGVCVPMSHWRARDPAQDFEEFFCGQYLKGPPCDKPLWSPVNTAELRRQSFEIVERLL